MLINQFKREVLTNQINSLLPINLSDYWLNELEENYDLLKIAVEEILAARPNVFGSSSPEEIDDVNGNLKLTPFRDNRQSKFDPLDDINSVN